MRNLYASHTAAIHCNVVAVPQQQEANRQSLETRRLDYFLSAEEDRGEDDNRMCASLVTTKHERKRPASRDLAPRSTSSGDPLALLV